MLDLDDGVPCAGDIDRRDLTHVAALGGCDRKRPGLVERRLGIVGGRRAEQQPIRHRAGVAAARRIAVHGGDRRLPFCLVVSLAFRRLEGVGDQLELRLGGLAERSGAELPGLGLHLEQIVAGERDIGPQDFADGESRHGAAKDLLGIADRIVGIGVCAARGNDCDDDRSRQL